jgi:hypothetical protein
MNAGEGVIAISPSILRKNGETIPQFSPFAPPT